MAHFEAYTRSKPQAFAHFTDGREDWPTKEPTTGCSRCPSPLCSTRGDPLVASAATAATTRSSMRNSSIVRFIALTIVGPSAYRVARAGWLARAILPPARWVPCKALARQRLLE